MSNDMATTIVWLTGGAVFLLVVSIWLIGTVAVYMRKTNSEERIEKRLDAKKGVDGGDGKRTLRLWHEGKMGTTTVPGLVSRRSIIAWLSTLSHGVGWKGSVFSFLFMVVGVAFFGFSVTLALTANIGLALCWFVVVPVVVNMVSTKYAQKQEHVFERQFADALALAGRSLRAGHPLLSAFQVIVEEMEPPVSTAFADILQQQALGKSLEEAIRTTAELSPSDDMKLFAASTVIQIRSGGNLADMMDRLVVVIRDRIRLQRRVRILTAQTQLSKRILIAVPFFLLALLAVMKPDYLEPLITTTPGRYMLIAATLLLLAGSWIMNKIATLKY